MRKYFWATSNVSTTEINLFLNHPKANTKSNVIFCRNHSDTILNIKMYSIWLCKITEFWYLLIICYTSWQKKIVLSLRIFAIRFSACLTTRLSKLFVFLMQKKVDSKFPKSKVLTVFKNNKRIHLLLKLWKSQTLKLYI